MYSRGIVVSAGAVVKRFGRGAEGSALAEYALLLALVTGGSVVVWQWAASDMSGPLRVVARHMGHREKSIPPVDARTLSAAGQMAGSEPTPFVPRTQVSETVFQLLVLLLGLAVLYSLRRRRLASRKQAKEEADPLESLSADQRRRLYEKRQRILNTFSNNTARLLESRVLVRHIMSHKVVSVPPSASRRELTGMMEEKFIRHLLVQGDGGRLLGVVSDRDLKYGEGDTAADLMTADPVTVHPDTPATTAVTTMINRSISCLPIMHEGRLQGILTSTDLMMSLQCTLQVLSRLAAEPDVTDDEARTDTDVDLPVGDRDCLSVS